MAKSYREDGAYSCTAYVMLIRLFTTFFKIGLTTFGGGYAMLPILERELVDRENWVSKEELMDYFAIGQSTPGIIAVNTATFVGMKQRGIVGAIVASLGIVAPSIMVILLIASFLDNLIYLEWFKNALSAIKVAVISLMVYSVYKLSSSAIKNYLSLFIFIVVLILMLKFNVSAPILVIGSGVFSILFIRGEK